VDRLLRVEPPSSDWDLECFFFLSCRFNHKKKNNKKKNNKKKKSEEARNAGGGTSTTDARVFGESFLLVDLFSGTGRDGQQTIRQ